MLALSSALSLCPPNFIDLHDSFHGIGGSSAQLLYMCLGISIWTPHASLIWYRSSVTALTARASDARNEYLNSDKTFRLVLLTPCVVCLCFLHLLPPSTHAGAWQQILHAVELGQVPCADFLALVFVCCEIIGIMHNVRTSSYG